VSFNKPIDHRAMTSEPRMHVSESIQVHPRILPAVRVAIATGCAGNQSSCSVIRDAARIEELTGQSSYCVLSFEALAELCKQGFKAGRLEDGFPGTEAAGLPTHVG
jgi:hypothetical protein